MKRITQEAFDELIKQHNGDCGANLEELRMSGVDFRKAGLRKANLRKSFLNSAVLRSCWLSEANLEGADLQHADLRDAVFNRANIRATYLFGADMRDARFIGADFRGSDFRCADCRRVDFTDADLRECVFGGNCFDERTVLRGADLRGVGLSDEMLYIAHWKLARINESDFEALQARRRRQYEVNQTAFEQRCKDINAERQRKNEKYKAYIREDREHTELQRERARTQEKYDRENVYWKE